MSLFIETLEDLLIFVHFHTVELIFIFQYIYLYVLNLLYMYILKIVFFINRNCYLDIKKTTVNFIE